MLPCVAIVGRPNVGKSTLFNRLVGRRKALVHDRPGVTRDRNYEVASWLEREYLLVDTGGFDPEPGDALYAAMRRQSEIAMGEADVVVFLVDGPAGITPADLASAKLVRTTGKPVVVAVNKCDEASHEDLCHEFWQLGFDEVLPVSAEHGRGMFELLDAVFSRLPKEEPTAPEAEDEREIRVSVLGRPNIGKSTLLNRLMGEDRFVVHDMPGTTVDATDAVLEWEGARFRLVDTAGIRRKARIDDRLESIAVSASIRAIERAHVVLLVVDGAEGVTEQDAHLAALVEERGRAMVVLVNKWDLVREDPERNVKVVEDEIARRLPHVPWAPALYISALTGKGCARILSVVRDVYGQFNQRIPTAKLNLFLRGAVAAYQPPQLHHHPVRLSYMTQVRVRPPTFTLFCNSPDGLGEGYLRYLQNRLREQFGFFGTPLRVQLRRKRRLGEAKEEDLRGLGQVPDAAEYLVDDEVFDEDDEGGILPGDQELEEGDDEGYDPDALDDGLDPADEDDLDGDEPDPDEPDPDEPDPDEPDPDEPDPDEPDPDEPDPDEPDPDEPDPDEADTDELPRSR